MSFEILPSSTKAMEVGTKRKTPPNKVYPFDELQVGQSFGGKLEENNWKSIRVLTSQRSKGGKRFVFVVHEEIGMFEVARTT